MADGWRAAPENEELMTIAAFLRNPLGGDPMSKRAAAGNTLSELFFGQAPQELERWARGNKPFKISKEGPRIQMNPSYDENTREQTNRGHALADVAFSIPATGSAKGGVAAGAGVVKPKGGSWLNTENLVGSGREGFMPEYPRYNAREEMFPGIEPFREKYGEQYKKKVDNWVKNQMGTEEDPLKDVRIGDTPFTWGELGDELVYKAKPEKFQFDTVREVKRDEFGEPIYGDDGRLVREEKPRAHYQEYMPLGGGEVSFTDSGKVAEFLRKWVDDPNPDKPPQYMAKPLNEGVEALVQKPREVPRETYSEGAPVLNPETGQGEIKWTSGKKFMGPLPEWNPPGGKGPTLYEEIATPLTDIGDYAGSYYQEALKANPKMKEFQETFPDMIRKWPKEYNTLERTNLEKNQMGTETLGDIPNTPFVLAKMTDPQAVKREGKLMRHCVGEYCNEAGKTKNFYSIRDKETMAPNVTMSTGITQAPRALEQNTRMRDLPQALRDPMAWAEQRLNNDQLRAIRQGAGDLPRIEEMAEMNPILQMVEANQRPGNWQDFIDANPAMQDFMGGQATTQELLQRQLPPELYERLAPLFNPIGKDTEAFQQVKGRANHPVHPKYQQALGEALRTMNERGVLPGSLEGSEAKFAQRIPFKGPEGKGWDYKTIPEAQKAVMNQMAPYAKDKTYWNATGKWQFAEDFGDRALRIIDDYFYDFRNGSRSLEDVMKELPPDALAEVVDRMQAKKNR